MRSLVATINNTIVQSKYGNRPADQLIIAITTINQNRGIMLSYDCVDQMTYLKLSPKRIECFLNLTQQPFPRTNRNTSLSST